MSNDRSFTQYFKDVCNGDIQAYDELPASEQEAANPGDLSFIEEYYEMTVIDSEDLEAELKWEAIETHNSSNNT